MKKLILSATLFLSTMIAEASPLSLKSLFPQQEEISCQTEYGIPILIHLEHYRNTHIVATLFGETLSGVMSNYGNTLKFTLTNVDPKRASLYRADFHILEWESHLKIQRHAPSYVDLYWFDGRAPDRREITCK